MTDGASRNAPGQRTASSTAPGPAPRGDSANRRPPREPRPDRFLSTSFHWRSRRRRGITARGTGPGRGFDLGLWSDAPVGEVMSRWRAFRHAMSGFDAVVLGNQVHGTVVETVDTGARVGADRWRGRLGDHCSPGVLLTVTVADCIPVYLAGSRTGRGAAARGLAGDRRRHPARAAWSASPGRPEPPPADVIMHCWGRYLWTVL